MEPESASRVEIFVVLVVTFLLPWDDCFCEEDEDFFLLMAEDEELPMVPFFFL